MSAFICSDMHINALVSWASRHQVSAYHDDCRWEVAGQEQETAELLRAENTLSVNDRYAQAEVPSAIVYSTSIKKLQPIEVLKAVNCLEYQSYEHPEWESSMAFAVCQAIKEAAIRLLPGYAAAEWEIKA